MAIKKEEYYAVLRDAGISEENIELTREIIASLSYFEHLFFPNDLLPIKLSIERSPENTTIACLVASEDGVPKSYIVYACNVDKSFMPQFHLSVDGKPFSAAPTLEVLGSSFAGHEFRHRLQKTLLKDKEKWFTLKTEITSRSADVNNLLIKTKLAEILGRAELLTNPGFQKLYDYCTRDEEIDAFIIQGLLVVRAPDIKNDTELKELLMLTADRC